MDSKNLSFFEQDDESYLLIDHYFLISKWYNYKILTIIMILMLIIYYCVKKVIMNMLLDILINIDQQLHRYK